MFNNVQLKRANKILDVDYELISGAILLFVSIQCCDLVTSSIIYINRSITVFILNHN